ncbi:unnamed protein product [Leptidea sinapis]|uniref:Cadherin domain-containing protein n=1 Tax=Leptidea sinapis TaxID=189913 RepID=A0A5E4R627_9NEOP|nr:unnamed protein product [Leptidea sinapis]
MNARCHMISTRSAGVIVTTGRALDREVADSHALEVSVTDGELSGAARVRVRLADVNDHAPAFTQRFYDTKIEHMTMSGGVTKMAASKQHNLTIATRQGRHTKLRDG